MELFKTFFQFIRTLIVFKKNRKWTFLCLLLLMTAAPLARGQMSNFVFLNQVFEFAQNYTAFYGDGKDGALTVPTAAWSTGTYIGYPTRPLSVNTTRSYLTANAAVGATTLTIATGYTSSTFDSATDTGFASCTSTCSASTHFQELLIIQMGGTNAGVYEFVQLQTRSGGTLTLRNALKNAYSATDKTQVILVPRYTTVTLNSGGFLSVGKWDGNTGGVIAFRANGTVSLNNSDSSGTGRYTSRIIAGHWQDNPGTAGYGFVGGTNASPNASSAFSLGATVSTHDGKSLTPASTERLMMGSGGRGTGGTGGAGGGVVIIKANTLNIGGQISAVAQNGTSAQGGAGGTVYVASTNIGEFAAGTCKTSGIGNVRATGGTGATSGADGRIFLYYGTSLTSNCAGAGAPAANTTVRPFVPK